MLTEERTILYVEDIARSMGTTAKRVRSLMRMGLIPHAKLGGRLVVPAEAWAKFVRSMNAQALPDM